MDGLDSRIITTFLDDPQIGVLGASRALGVARGTVQARLDRLLRDGVLTLGPQVHAAALGYGVTAFCTVQIEQAASTEALLAHLATLPQVVEVHSITGDGDLMVRLVARDNADLQRVIDEVVADPQVDRTSTVVALTERIAARTRQLVPPAG
jgi:DNA-binding Lrp family transcriptional regulator